MPQPARFQNLSSGDSVLDRRRQWALAAGEEGFHQAAAEIYEQILAEAPGWAVGWFELAAAREKAGDLPGAISAYASAATHDRQGVLGASLRLAALGAAPSPPAAPQAYVRALFDCYAKTFVKHLVEALDYRGPAILRDALERACAETGRTFHFGEVYDLGCGAGLMAQEIRSHCDAIDGVDLSPKMIEAAQAAGFYRSLFVGDAAAFLAARDKGHAQLVLAADVFVYIGDLEKVFAAARKALQPDGLFAFSVQQNDDADFKVGEDMRFSHSESYLRTLARSHCFDMLVLEKRWARKDRGAAVPGLVAVLRKAPVDI